MATATRILRATRGTTLTCKGWPQEAARRMLMNNVDPGVAERPDDLRDDLIVYRGTRKAWSVASPNQKTEGMLDLSDAIADRPPLNALLNASSGATWVSVHHGGGLGIGSSLHAGMVVVADGTAEADAKLERVLTCDPGIGGVRHADAGYQDAMATADRHGPRVPMHEDSEC